MIGGNIQIAHAPTIDVCSFSSAKYLVKPRYSPGLIGIYQPCSLLETCEKSIDGFSCFIKDKMSDIPLKLTSMLFTVQPLKPHSLNLLFVLLL